MAGIAGIIFNIGYFAVCAFMALIYLGLFAVCIECIYREFIER